MDSDNLIPNQGDYRQLYCYQKAESLFDMTYFFCHHYLEKGDRTIDQMVQAARSGKQNIVEGCAASAVSKETEIKLVSVAKASLQELLVDYEDYLRTREHRQWEEESIEFKAMRLVGQQHNDTEYFMKLTKPRPPQTIANMAIVLIKQTDYLLYKLLQQLGRRFLNQGGFRENMTRMRLKRRDEQKNPLKPQQNPQQNPPQKPKDDKENKDPKEEGA